MTPPRDTHADVHSRLRRMYSALPGQRRLEMGCGMFDDAKAMAEAGILAETPGLDRLALKRALFRRLFGRDFTEEKIEKITRCIATER